MTVNELIEELLKLQKKGKGEYLVFTDINSPAHICIHDNIKQIAL